jgi:hypothetical protein
MEYPLVWESDTGLIHFILTDFSRDDIDCEEKQQILCEPGFFYGVFKTRKFVVADLPNLCPDCKKAWSENEERRQDMEETANVEFGTVAIAAAEVLKAEVHGGPGDQKKLMAVHSAMQKLPEMLQDRQFVSLLVEAIVLLVNILKKFSANKLFDLGKLMLEVYQVYSLLRK